MDQETPIWLNLCFVEKILQKSEGDNSIQVIKILPESATNKGDNYSSELIRMNMEYVHKKRERKIAEKKSIIIKIAPTVEGVLKNIKTQSGAFHKEISMMTNTLCKMNELIAPKYRLSGQILYVKRDDPIFLAMEDLVPLGFRMADRVNGLDLPHSILALHGLARFHATSVAVCEKEPEQKKIYRKGPFNSECAPELEKLYILGTKTLAEEIKERAGMKKYADKIAKLSDRIYKIGMDASKFCEDDFNVLNHGDYWVNNILFKYNDEGKPIEQICVDFQECVYTTPAFDLDNFLSTSPSPDIVEDNRNVLLNEYLSTLAMTMRQINCKTQPPTMKQLKTTLKQKASFGMIASFALLPLIMAEQSEAKGIDELLRKDGTYSNPTYKNKAYLKVISQRLPKYDEWGLLDL